MTLNKYGYVKTGVFIDLLEICSCIRSFSIQYSLQARQTSKRKQRGEAGADLQPLIVRTDSVSSESRRLKCLPARAQIFFTAQLKAVIQCATVSFFLLETETHFMFFSVKVSFRRIGLFFHNVSLSPAKTISLKCKHLKSNACRTVVSIIWLSGADRFTHTAQQPINKIACRVVHCPVCWPKKKKPLRGD